MCCCGMVFCGLVSTQEVIVCRLNTRIMVLLNNLYIYVLRKTQHCPIAMSVSPEKNGYLK